MNEIIFAQEKYSTTITDEIFKIRHEAFIERLQWEITSEGGMERDRFDDIEAHHIAVRSPDGVIGGCWRALPTTSDYMLRSVFPELLQGEALPEEENVWEISRFAVRKGSSKSVQGYMSSVTIDLVRSFGEFAERNGIKNYVAVTTVACERLLRQLGVSIRRLGEGNSLQIGKERSVALWIKVDDNLRVCNA